MTIGERIRFKRTEKDLSQTDLAKLCGYYDKTVISRFEHAGNDISMKQVKRIAEALNVSPAYLMGWEEDEKVKQLINAYEHGDFLRSITDNEIELLKRIRILEAFYTKEQIERGLEFITLYQNSIPEIQTAVDSLLKSQKHDS